MFTEKLGKVGVSLRASGYPHQWNCKNDPQYQEATHALASLTAVAPAMQKNDAFKYAADLLQKTAPA